MERAKKKTNHPRRHPTPKEIRQTAAEARQLLRVGRTNQQQLARLDQAFGVGLGAVRERARLNNPESKQSFMPVKKVPGAAGIKPDFNQSATTLADEPIAAQKQREQEE